jgi:glycosyltransferase 2 family protein
LTRSNQIFYRLAKTPPFGPIQLTMSLKKGLQFLLFATIGSVILYLVFRSQNASFQAQCALDGIPSNQCSLSEKLLADFGTVNWLWMLGVVAAFTISNLFRAKRWQMQHTAIGYQTRLNASFWSILLGYFANLGFPRMGEVVRAGALSKADQVPIEKVVGTLVVDRLMDFFCLFLVILLAFLFEFDTLYQFLEKQGVFGARPGATGQSNKALILLTVAGLGLVSFFALRKRLAKTAVGQKLLHMVSGFKEGLLGIFKMKHPILFLVLSFGIWLMFYLQCLFGLWAFPPTAGLGPTAALLVFVIGTFGFIIPSPGGMGTYHALAIAALSLYGINGADSFSYANISFFSIQIIYNLVGGVLALVILPRLGRVAS